MLHHVAPCCTMLRCTMLHHVAPCCTMLHHVAPVGPNNIEQLPRYPGKSWTHRWSMGPLERLKGQLDCTVAVDPFSFDGNFREKAWTILEGNEGNVKASEGWTQEWLSHIGSVRYCKGIGPGFAPNEPLWSLGMDLSTYFVALLWQPYAAIELLNDQGATDCAWSRPSVGLEVSAPSPCYSLARASLRKGSKAVRFASTCHVLVFFFCTWWAWPDFFRQHLEGLKFEVNCNIFR